MRRIFDRFYMYFVIKFCQITFDTALLKITVAYHTVHSAPNSDRKI